MYKANINAEQMIILSVSYHIITDITLTDINECASLPCQNGGTCTDHVAAFSCTCAVGYTDTLCQTSIKKHFKFFRVLNKYIYFLIIAK